ncbi:MAG: polyribonucleotide nucleotidyltransferase [Bacteroidota bacterium]
MGKQIPIDVTFNLPDGREVTIETGKLATQADGSVVVRMGKTMLFASVVSATEAREGQKFFPLSVDYQEKFAAAGRIPGNFFKREARLSDYEVLICRLVDRVIRPLFPDGYMNDTQVIINLISADEDVMPDALAALAASAALAVSPIPFAGPISEVRVARINGEHVINPGRTALKEADLDIIVGATTENVMMVEGEANECSEADLVEAIRIGHEAIKVQCEAQLALAEKVGEKATVKRDVEPMLENEELKEEIAGMIKEDVKKIAKSFLDKKTRKEQFKANKNKMEEDLLASKGEEFMEENKGLINRYWVEIHKKTIREIVLAEKIRLDGRKPDEVRPIWTEVDYLPAAHGSAIFNRGETQAITSLTLGTKLDEQMIDNALEFSYNKFILHYNFPAFSVGEIKPMRGPGRREVGHANLASRSLKQVLPPVEDMPYTLRIVSDILESNGSSSMATVCAGSLALMDAGIQIKSPVSGIAMGMISDGETNVVLSDILGDEDAMGDMDFKVTGTENGITACQMDIKIDGLPYDLLEEALMQAKAGRIHILNEMAKSIGQPREDLKPHAPRMVQLTIEKSFIGAVIGPGGKVIQEMQKETNTIINIEEVDEKGIVTIASSDKDSLDMAVNKIKAITYVPEVGDEYEAKVVTIMPYGVFAEFLPGKSGLVHISELSWTRIEKIEDTGLTEGDLLKVRLIGIDPKSGKFKLSRKVLMEKPEGWKPRPPRDGNKKPYNKKR